MAKVIIESTKDGFTVTVDGQTEKFTSVDRALQDARGALLGTDTESPEEDMTETTSDSPDETEKDFEEGFKKARGTPL